MSNIVSIGRRIVLLLAAALIVATMALMSAGPASADDGLSDSQLRHKIHQIQDRPGPVTNKEENHIDKLKDRIQDNDDNNEDDDEDDEEDDNDND